MAAIEVGKTSDLSEGKMKRFMADGREILVALVQGKLYAADNRCPHMGASLSQGKLEGTIVTCPLHGSRFDLSDGHVVSWAPKLGILSTASQIIRHAIPLVTYQVAAEGDRIMVETPPAVPR